MDKGRFDLLPISGLRYRLIVRDSAFCPTDIYEGNLRFCLNQIIAHAEPGSLDRVRKAF